MVNEKTVIKNVNYLLFDKRIAIIEALNRYYASEALRVFQKYQPPVPASQGKFWFNRTAQAALTVFSNSFKNKDEMGFFIAHNMLYGVYLTLANDRKNDGLTPVISELYPKYLEDLVKLLKKG